MSCSGLTHYCPIREQGGGLVPPLVCYNAITTTHCGTKGKPAVSHHSSIFAQLLCLVPRHAFEKLAREHHAGAPLRGMSRWKQFVALAAG
jgi:hypothetical protein